MENIDNEKREAINMIFDWFLDKNRTRQFISLGGYAGTGKTYLLGLLRQKLFEENYKIKIAFATFTGKASQVLSQRLKEVKAIYKGDKLGTIHSLIYEAIDDGKGGIMAWKKQEEINFDLIILDEASMVSKDIWRDLLSYQVPILVVGDHGQLPPIGDGFNLMEKPDIVLSKIFRQEKNSPIIDLSCEVRANGKIKIGKFGKGVIKYDRKDSETFSLVQELLEEWNEETMFLVGRNRTRLKLNEEIRIMREIYSMSPVVGDRVICLKNNWRKGIYNGMLGTISEIQDSLDRYGRKSWYEADIFMDDGNNYSGIICAEQFNREQAVRTVEGLSYKDIGDLFDFGYCLTVHKAQGSQARKVIVFEERNKYMSDEEWQRWLYTAVTRATEELVIIGD